jgi:hypothetical protein
VGPSLASLVRNAALAALCAGTPFLSAQDEKPKEPPKEALQAPDGKFRDYKSIENSVICIRNTAFREQPLYAKDGTLLHAYSNSIHFGTGWLFAEKDIDGTSYIYILTNHHVANDDLVDWGGRKKFLEVNEIVDNFKDRYRKDDLPLEFIGSDPKRDVALLRVKKEAIDQYNKEFKKNLQVCKAPIGDSDTLEKLDTIIIEGYPHALERVTTTGVVGHKDFLDEHPDYGWNHKDIIIDAAINPGNSGSPAFRKNKDGTLEFMGIVHAGFRAEGLKLFVRVNEFKEVLTDLAVKAVVTPKLEVSQKELDGIIQFASKATETERIYKAFRDPIQVSLKNGPNGTEITHTIYTGNFPLDQKAKLELQDLSSKEGAKAATDGLGTIDKLVINDRGRGRRELDVNTLPADLKTMAQQVYTVLDKILLRTIEYKSLTAKLELNPVEQELANGLLKHIERLERNYGQVYNVFQQNLTVYLEQERLKK